MRHEISIVGRSFAIRPVDTEDAEFILELRLDADLSRYLNPTSPSLEHQQEWLQRYLERDGDYYFIIVDKFNGDCQGTIAIYDLSIETNTAEWGRWIVRPGSTAAIESVLLMYAAAFDVLGLEAVYCRTVAENKRVVSFHASCGLHMVDDKRTVNLRDRTFNVVEQRLERRRWPAVRQNLDRVAARLAERCA
jgi:RimJ/RimL family protein N-acetyltransferase